MNAMERMEYLKSGNSFSDSAHLEYISLHKPKYLYQYRSGDVLNYKNLFNQQVWLSFPLYLNDPFEYNYGTYANGVLISCFTERYDSLLMWSHYANGHSGFCVKYNFDDIYKYAKLNVFPVIYNTERFRPVLKEKGNAGEIISTFIHKASEWKYEKEWRIIKLISVVDRKILKLYAQKGELFGMPKPVEVIMGCHLYDYDNRLKLVEFCKDNNILISRMHMKDTKYQLYKRKQQFSWYNPPEDNLDEYFEAYLKTDAAKRDLQKMRKQEKEYRKIMKEKMKNYL